MTRSDDNPALAQRARMVDRQLRSRGVRDPRVLDAMTRVPREDFVPSDQRDWAYDDRPLPIGIGQTISQPYIVAAMTEYTGIQPEDRVLEIGTGCGYQTAVLAELAREVYTVERLAPLAQDAERRLRGLGYTNVHFRTGDGFQGWETHAPYDVILVSAAPITVPPALLEQLAERGRLVIPVGPRESQDLKRFVRSTGQWREETLFDVRFVPMLPGTRDTTEE